MAEDIYITEKDSEFFSIAIVQGWIVYNESEPLNDGFPYVEFNLFRLCRELDCTSVRIRDNPYVELHFMRNNSTVMIMEICGIHCRGGIVLQERKDISQHFFGPTNEMLNIENQRKRRHSPRTPTDRILNALESLIIKR